MWSHHWDHCQKDPLWAPSLIVSTLQHRIKALLFGHLRVSVWVINVVLTRACRDRTHWAVLRVNLYVLADALRPPRLPLFHYDPLRSLIPQLTRYLPSVYANIHQWMIMFRGWQAAEPPSLILAHTLTVRSCRLLHDKSETEISKLCFCPTT